MPGFRWFLLTSLIVFSQNTLDWLAAYGEEGSAFCKASSKGGEASTAVFSLSQVHEVAIPRVELADIQAQL